MQILRFAQNDIHGMARLALSLLPFAVLSFSFGFARSAPAAQTASEDQNMNFTLEGKITKVAGNKLTVNTEGNILFTVICNDKTEVKRADGSPGAARDLQIGIRIHVDGDLMESGDIIAHKIAILPQEKK